MSLNCEEFDHWVDPQASGVSAEERRQWNRHLEGCPRCRQQHEAHEMLKVALVLSPDLSFSDGFEASLNRRLAESNAPRSLSFAARALLTAYGIVAVGLSGWILSEIDWPSAIPMDSFGVLLGLVALGTPILLLHHRSPFAPSGIP